MRKLFSLVGGFSLLVGLAFIACQLMVSPGLAEEGARDPLKPVNLTEIDFAVPWGLRLGKNTRIYFQYDVNQQGVPENITILRNIPHHHYNSVAKTALEKYRFPPGEARKGLLEELHYCVLSDHQSTFACKIRFQRLGAPDQLIAKTPDDPGYYEIDKYSGPGRVLKYQPPEFPRQAALTNTCGWLEVDFALKKNGRPKDIRILETSDANLFSLSVRNALTGFRFSLDGGKERIKYLISFDIPGVCQAGLPTQD